ncbi:MAG: hypothetical protein IPH11_13795 [Ignavibacteriales bacterium]|nr:hypothetical protein [Ignavibacteriales bacterium]
MVRLFGYLSFALFLLITSLSCDSSEPPPVLPPPDIIKDTITVSIESFTHRSVTFRVQSTVHGLQSSIKVLRSFNSTETIIAEFPLEVADTTITDDDNGIGLMLDTTYTYFAVRVDSLGEETDTSNIVMQKTLAPTSHNYTWQEFTFGDAGYPNTLYDVWGTDENNVWACGGVKINDTVYGIIKWNGVEWKPISKAGGVAIYGFSDNDIWTVGGAVYHFDGTVWSDLTEDYDVFIDNIPYTSLWGTSSSDMYFGNAWGKIIHWDGVNANIVYENSDPIPITDIYGTSNNFILACGSALSTPSIALIFNGTSWDQLQGLNYGNTLFRTVFGWNPYDYFVGGSKTYRYLNGVVTEILQQAPGILEKIRADKSTGEIVSVGDGFTLLHFNGVDWKDYSYDLNQPNSAFYGVYLTNGKIFATGGAGIIGKIFIGTQN